MPDPAPALVLPEIDDLNRPFWEGCAAGELRLQVCRDCGRIRYPISGTCPNCLSTAFAWQALSGAGEILSWVVYHRAYHPAWADRVPYNVVLVQLREGPRMFGNVEPLGTVELSVGAAVQVVFIAASGPSTATNPEPIVLPRWRLV
jgi:hypothetical protein